MQCRYNSEGDGACGRRGLPFFRIRARSSTPDFGLCRCDRGAADQGDERVRADAHAALAEVNSYTIVPALMVKAKAFMVKAIALMVNADSKLHRQTCQA